MENYSVDIKKLITSKAERIIELINDKKGWLEIKRILILNKLSMDSLLKNNGSAFDKSDESYIRFMELYPNFNKFNYNLFIPFVTYLESLTGKSVDWKRMTILSDHIDFDSKYESIQSSLIDLLNKLDVMDFTSNLDVLDDIFKQTDNAFEQILHSNIKDTKSYSLLNAICEMLDVMDYDKKHKDDVVSTSDVDSLVVSLNASLKECHGLVKNYLRNDVNGESHLSVKLKMYDEVRKVLKDKFDDRTLSNLFNISESSLNADQVILDMRLIKLN